MLNFGLATFKMFHPTNLNYNTLNLEYDIQLTWLPYAEGKVWIGLNR